MKSLKREEYYLRWRRFKNRLFILAIATVALLACVPLFFIFGYVLAKGLPALNLSFFTEMPQPLGEPGGGVAHAIHGSLIVVGLACLIGIPWGVGAGIFLSEVESLPAKVVRFSADILASVPSILIGLFAYALIVFPMKTFSSLSAAVALAVIMIPLVARGTEQLIRQTPKHIYEAGYALGLQRWKVILRIVVKGSWPGIMTAVLIAVARIAGETAPLLLTAFGNAFGYRGLLQPIATLPVQIYEYAISPYESWQQLAWTSSLVLLGFIFFINVIVRLIIKLSSTETRS